MEITPHSRYRGDLEEDQDLSSDDSFDWSSDPVPNTKIKSARKANTISSAKSPIKKKKAKKPGRKPLEAVTVLPSDPKLKRKAQNRAAQRAFRERKEQFVNELQDQMRELQEAKEKCEKELFAENARLKKENERLKEENYLLKDAKTCQLPSKKVPSPEMDGQSQADESMPETRFIKGEPKFTFDKDTLFLNDSTEAETEADFLVQGEPCPALFGAEMDFFGSSTLEENNNELDAFFSEQQDAVLKCAPENEQPCKKKVLGMLRRARGTNRSIAQINQDVKSYCPDFNLDQLCQALKQKMKLDPHHTLTDDDVDLYIECIQRNA